jgi:hypothetical protein
MNLSHIETNQKKTNGQEQAKKAKKDTRSIADINHFSSLPPNPCISLKLVFSAEELPQSMCLVEWLWAFIYTSVVRNHRICPNIRVRISAAFNHWLKRRRATTYLLTCPFPFFDLFFHFEHYHLSLHTLVSRITQKKPT